MCGFFRFLSINLFTYQFVTITNDAKDIYFPFPFSVRVRRLFSRLGTLILSIHSHIDFSRIGNWKNFFLRTSSLIFFRFTTSTYLNKAQHFFSVLIWDSCDFFLYDGIITIDASLTQQQSEKEREQVGHPINFPIRKLLQNTRKWNIEVCIQKFLKSILFRTSTEWMLKIVHWLVFNLCENLCNFIGYSVAFWKHRIVHIAFFSIEFKPALRLLIYGKVFVSRGKIQAKKSAGPLPHTLSSVDFLCIKSHLSSDCIGLRSKHTTREKKLWSKYEDQVHAITLIYMNRAGSRILFNNNSPTCNALRMTESSVLVAVLHRARSPA